MVKTVNLNHVTKTNKINKVSCEKLYRLDIGENKNRYTRD